MLSDFKYWAFISYSHKDNRKERNLWGDWLQASVENFTIPSELVGSSGRSGQQVPARLYPVFQDEKELPANADLDETIREALKQSRYLIVICSPRSAKSDYVNREILEFKRLGRSHGVLAIIVDGEPNVSDPARECFPEALRYLLGADGEVDVARPANPIAADVRHEDGREPSLKDKDHHPVLEREKLRVIAGLLQTGFDDLFQRDRERQLREERKRTRRLRILMAGFAALALVATLAGLWAMSQKREAQRQKLAAETQSREVVAQKKNVEEQKKKADAEKEKAIEALSQSDFLQAQRLIKENKYNDALAYLQRSLAANPNNPAVITRLTTLLAGNEWMMPRLRLQHNGVVASAQFSPDGKWIATGSWDRTARVWDAQSGTPLTGPLTHLYQLDSRGEFHLGKTASPWISYNPKITSVQFSPNGTKILTFGDDLVAWVWEAQTGRLLAVLHNQTTFQTARFSPNGKQIVTTGPETVARIWDTETGQPLKRLEHGSGVLSAEFSPDGTQILTGSLGDNARIWDVQTGKVRGEPMKHGAAVNSAEFSPDGRWLVTASRDGTARIWETGTGRPLGEPMKHGGRVRAAHFSRDGKWIATCADDHTARVWEALTGRPLTEPLRHDGEIKSVRFSPNGNQIVTASEDKTARVWDAQTGQPVIQPLMHDDAVNTAEFSPDGKSIVTTCSDKCARVWDARLGQALAERLIQGSTNTLEQFGFDAAFITPGLEYTIPVLLLPPSDLIIVAVDDSPAPTAPAKNSPGQNQSRAAIPTFSLADTVPATAAPKLVTSATVAPANQSPAVVAPTERLMLENEKHRYLIGSARFSPDSKRIITACYNNAAQIWDAETGRPLAKPLMHTNAVAYAEFSPDGKRIVTASLDKSARVWDAETGQPMTEPLKHEGGVVRAQFSPDGKQIVTASLDKTARVWDAQTGRLLTDFLKHDGIVNSAEFSPDGKKIVTSSEDGTARVWDAQTGKPLTEPLKHDGGVVGAQFSPDGKRILTASRDKTVRMWDAETGQPLMEPLRHYGEVFARFSADGKRILTASADKTARVWDAGTGQPLTEWLRHDGGVIAQFSPDGKRVVTASADKTARVWDAETGQPLTEPLKHDGGVIEVRFSPDGRRILTASWDTCVRVWDIGPVPSKYPDWLLTVVEAISGQALNNQGVLEPTKLNRREVLNQIGEKLSQAAENDDWTMWGRWLLGESSARTVSPFSKMTIPEYIDEHMRENSASALKEAEGLAWGNTNLLRRITQARASGEIVK